MVLISVLLLVAMHTLVAVVVVLVLLVVIQLGPVVATLLQMELVEVVVLVGQILVYLDLSLAQSCQVHG